MSWASDSWMRLRALLSRHDREEQIDDEISLHIELLAQDLERRGVDPDTARREARRRFGDVRAIRKELSRMERKRIDNERRATYSDELRQDLRYGMRQLLRNPLFTAIVIGTLAVGIGANTAVFSVFKGVFLDPLPYHQPDRLTYGWSARE